MIVFQWGEMLQKFLERPRTAGIVVGAVIGAVVGALLIGNFGVASRGQGFGVWGWLLGSALGAYIGFRVGEWRLRKGRSL